MKSWRVTNPGKFYDENEGSVVYFDPHSGDTHLLTDFAAHIVRQLTAAAMSTKQLEERLTTMADSADQLSLQEGIATVIGELVDLGIVHEDHSHPGVKIDAQ